MRERLRLLARHGRNRNIGRGFVKGFGLRAGALASSVGHDSHNVCVVGADDADMALAVNRLIALEGGFVAVRDGAVLAELPLPFQAAQAAVEEDGRHARPAEQVLQVAGELGQLLDLVAVLLVDGLELLVHRLELLLARVRWPSRSCSSPSCRCR